jgi:hypothetical protein
MARQLPTGSTPGPAYTRRWLRYKVDVPLRVIVSKLLRDRTFHGRGISLSEGGMGLFAAAELEPGDKVAVELMPPYSPAPVRLDARICNRTGYAYGLEFLTDTNTRQFQAAGLRKHLSSLVGMSLPPA